MKVYSQPIEEHPEVPLADDGLCEAIVKHWTRREAPQRAAAEAGNACYVLAVQRPGDRGRPEAQLAELVSLVEAQGDRVVGTDTHELHRADPRTLVRSGVADRIGTRARDLGADLLVIDAEPTPSQMRNLENARRQEKYPVIRTGVMRITPARHSRALVASPTPFPFLMRPRAAARGADRPGGDHARQDRAEPHPPPDAAKFRRLQ